VLFENGPVFDEYREINNRARIGLNWSSLDDLNARAYELAAMKLAPVMNVVTDLDASGIECATFRTLPEAVEAVMYLKEHDDKRLELAGDAYRSVQGQTYDARISQIFKEVGF
jgi:spore maturation protein CgeB